MEKSRHINYKESLPRIHDIQYANGTYFISYDKYYPRVDRIRFEIAKLNAKTSKWTVIYSTPFLDAHYYALGNGGRIQIEKDILYFSLGDYSLDRRNELPSDFAAQNPDLPWGKINELNLQTLEYRVYTLGHRNPQGLVRLSDGRLLDSEHGPRGGDELNIIIKGRNYGWPASSYGTQYGSYQRIGTDADAKYYEPPIYSFIPSIAPTQLIEAKNFDPLWDGDVLMGSLKAMTLYRMRLSKNSVLFSEPILIGQRIRDIRQVGKSIVLLTDDRSLIFLANAHKTTPTNLSQTFGRCVECHSFEPGRNSLFAPNLNNIYQKYIASSTYFSYSSGLLARKNEKWSGENLKDFLKSPSVFAPGTAMPQLNLNDRQIGEIINALKQHN